MTAANERSEKTGKRRTETRGTPESFAEAAQAFADRMLPPDAVAHVREAVRHLLRAGISALDEADRRSQERGRRKP